MQPSGEKSQKRQDPARPLDDEDGPRIVESERELPTRGMTPEQFRAAVRELMNL